MSGSGEGLKILESSQFSIELGIVRNPQGRIVETGWPDLSHNVWPEAYRELGMDIVAQVQRELGILTQYRKSGKTHLLLDGKAFHLDMHTLFPDANNEITSQLHQRSRENTFRVLEVGGGIGDLSLALLKRFGLEGIAFDVTSLVHFQPPKALEADGMRSVRTMAIELPHDDMAGKYDLILCQNSVFHWSHHPELATLNIWKLLREGGVALVTIPTGPRRLPTGEFTTTEFFYNNGLFTAEKLSSRHSGDLRFCDHVARLVKNS